MIEKKITWTKILFFLFVSIIGSEIELSAAGVELRLSHFMPTRHVQHKVMEEWAQELQKQSENSISITIFPGGALGKASNQYDSVLSDVTDIAFGLPSYTPGRFPLASVMELPFLSESAEQGSEAFWNLYQKYLTDEFQDTKVLWLLTSTSGQIHTTKKAVRSMADLKGLKIRSPGASVSKMLGELGAIPISMPITEVYMGLERGTIDGICAPWGVMRPFKLYEQLKFTTELNMYTQTFFVTMNKATYESLPANLKQLIDEMTGKRMALTAGAAYDESDFPNKKISVENGIEIIALSREEIKRWREKVQPLHQQWLESMTRKGLPAQQAYDFLLHELKNEAP